LLGGKRRNNAKTQGAPLEEPVPDTDEEQIPRKTDQQLPKQKGQHNARIQDAQVEGPVPDTDEGQIPHETTNQGFAAKSPTAKSDSPSFGGRKQSRRLTRQDAPAAGRSPFSDHDIKHSSKGMNRSAETENHGEAEEHEKKCPCHEAIKALKDIQRKYNIYPRLGSNVH